MKKKKVCASVNRAGWKPGAEKSVLKFVVWFDLISEMLGRLLVCVTASVLTGQNPLYPELNGKCEHCCRKHIFLHFPLICLPSQEALTWVVHQFKRVDFFFTPFLSLFFSLPPPTPTPLFSLNRQLLWHIGSVRNERYSCRHAILVMKSQLDLLHDWFCNLLFSGSAQNEMMSCWRSFKYP